MALVEKLKATMRFLRYGPTRVRALEERLQDLGDAQAREHAALQSALRELAARMTQAEQKIASDLALAAAELRRTSDSVQRDFDSLRSQLSGLRAGLDRVAVASNGAASPSASAAEEGFYPVLEAHFRGPEALVKERLAAYREWVTRMPAGRIADLGCGRGEWLELLKTWGRDAAGVDANALVVQQLQGKGLAVEQGDLIAWLQAQPDASLAGVTAFHVVEHLPFGVLLRMLQEAERALMPGGIVIMETPNPENIDVATRTFWVDPSHVRPLPPELLVLAAQYCGFRAEELARLNPPESGEGAGRDYALVGRKVRA